MTKFFSLVIILASFVVLYEVGRSWKLKPETPYDHSPYLGEMAVLRIQGGENVWLAQSTDDCYSLNVAMMHKDSDSLRRFTDEHAAFPVPAGTRVKVIGESGSRKHVQIVDGPLAGKTGWVEFEYVRPRQPGEFQ